MSALAMTDASEEGADFLMKARKRKLNQTAADVAEGRSQRVSEAPTAADEPHVPWRKFERLRDRRPARAVRNSIEYFLGSDCRFLLNNDCMRQVLRFRGQRKSLLPRNSGRLRRLPDRSFWGSAPSFSSTAGDRTAIPDKGRYEWVDDQRQFESICRSCESGKNIFDRSAIAEH